MQLSVARYKAIGVDRGASLDTLDVPLNNRLWLQRSFADAHGDAAAIERILNWTDPGPGGFYDDLGDPGRQPHLVRGTHWPGISSALAEVLVDVCRIAVR